MSSRLGVKGLTAPWSNVGAGKEGGVERRGRRKGSVSEGYQKETSPVSEFSPEGG